MARTEAHRFRILEPDRDETKALRALTRAREDPVVSQVALGNQLRAELQRGLDVLRDGLTAHFSRSDRWRIDREVAELARAALRKP